MKKIISIVSLLILIAYPALGGGGLGYNWKPWEAKNTIWVEEGESIANAVSSANSGDVIVLHPGTYTETDVIIDKSLTITGVTDNWEDAVWQGDTRLARIRADVTFCNLSFEQLTDVGQMISIDGSYRMDLNNTCLTFYNLIANRDTSEWMDTQWYPLVHNDASAIDTAGFVIPRGRVWVTGSFQIGDPLVWTGGGHYGIRVINGATFHTRCSNACIYADSTAVIVQGGAQAVFYNNAIVSVAKQATDCPAVMVSGAGSVFSIFEGEVYNNDPASIVPGEEKPTIYVYDGGKARVRYSYVKNGGGGRVYYSTSTTASEIMFNHFIGGVTYGANDEVSNCGEGYAQFTVTSTGTLPGDSLVVFTNKKTCSVLITQIEIESNTENCDLTLWEYTLAGAAAGGVIDSLEASTGAGGVWYNQYTSFDHDTIEAGNKIWVKESVVAGDWANVVIEYQEIYEP